MKPRISYRKKLLVSVLALCVALSGATAYAASGAVPQEHKHQKKFSIVEDSAAILGISTDQLKRSLEKGQSIADVVKEHHMSEADFTQKLLDSRNKRIDEAVKSGKITVEKAEHIKSKMKQHIAQRIGQKGLRQPDHKRPEHRQLEHHHHE